MRRLMFKSFSGKLFGIHYERVRKNLMICLLLYATLYASELRIPVAPFILYLISAVHTACVMWRVLSSREHSACLKNMRMLPFEDPDFVLAWTGALGIYTFVMQTGPILSVLWAVASFNGMEILKSFLCALCAAAVTALVYSRKSRPYFALLWAGINAAGIFLLKNGFLFFMAAAVNFSVVLLCLIHTDADVFFPEYREAKRTQKALRHGLVIQYLLRYLQFHPNYLINTMFMWGIACVLPLFFRQMEGSLFFFIGFAVLSLNTPAGILLSCDPDLEQAVRFLPEQEKRFFLPYGIFVLLCNLTADAVFLCSWKVLNGSVPLWAVIAAVLFALSGAAGTVLLEWLYPIRNWRVENDLWHHPRKYIVPIVLLLTAGIFCMVTGI